jgi:hypothetical protein
MVAPINPRNVDILKAKLAVLLREQFGPDCDQVGLLGKKYQFNCLESSSVLRADEKFRGRLLVGTITAIELAVFDFKKEKVEVLLLSVSNHWMGGLPLLYLLCFKGDWSAEVLLDRDQHQSVKGELKLLS